MAFPYKHVLLIGATSGIGKEMADRLVKEGVKVTAVGRRKDRVDQFVQKHGAGRADGVTFDIADTAKAPQFAADIMRKSPDIDCIFLNAGVQRNHNWSEPAKVDLASFNNEIQVNFISFVALTHAFLPHLLGNKFQTGIIFTGSHLAIVPAVSISAYSASKAALNSFILCLRDQLRNSTVKIIELSPPVVQTELHDYMGEETGRNMGMPIEKFIDQAYDGLKTGNPEVYIGTIGGSSHEAFDEIVAKRTSAFDELAKLIRGN
ncbi:short-chain dehydrogenase/oxidoreductase [Tricladium varicosporioides]|nr:short-chain dehydrogenase/oxidoreductase [Hymenoscyphus varicosporioides]